MTKSIMSRFLVDGVLLESKSPMPEELAKDKAWANEVGELQKRLIPLLVNPYRRITLY
jgi:hypothetical protein